MDKPRYLYYEDDWIAEVEIVRNMSTDKALSYELKVIRTVQESKIYKPTEDGTIFNFYENRDAKGIIGHLELI